jgi:hypothetical protein
VKLGSLLLLIYERVTEQKSASTLGNSQLSSAEIPPS